MYDFKYSNTLEIYSTHNLFLKLNLWGLMQNLQKNYLSLFLFRARSPSIYHFLSIFIYTLFTYKPWDAKAAIGNHPPKVESELRNIPRLRNPLSFVSTTGVPKQKTDILMFYLDTVWKPKKSRGYKTHRK